MPIATKALEVELSKQDAAKAPKEPPIAKEVPALIPDQRAAIGDFVRRCWTYNVGAKGIDQFQVQLKVDVDENGTAREAKVVGPDVARMNADPVFRIFAERGIRAVLDPQCANLPLPHDMLGQRRTLDFRFSP